MKSSDLDLDKKEAGWNREVSETVYKATFRFSTGQFEYIEILAQGTPESLKTQFDAFQRALKVGTGLPDKDFNRVLDEFCWGKGSMEVAEWEGMNEDQQFILQAVKRSKKRQSYKTK